MGEFDYLLNQVPFQLPDPYARSLRELTLADLAQKQKMQDYELKGKQREIGAQEALARAWPDLVRGGFSDPSMLQAVTSGGEYGPEISKAALAQQKALLEGKKTSSEIQKTDVDTRAKAYDYIGSAAAYEARNPTPDSLPKMEALAKTFGYTLDPYTGDPADNKSLSQHFDRIASQTYHLKDRIANELTAGAHKETERHDLVGEAAAEADRKQRMDIANMSDARARDLNAATRDTAAATREAAKSQQTINTEMKLADDYRTQSKGFQTTALAINKIHTALDTATTNPGSALSAGTAFMKILDAESVVRETELGMALNASGWFDRMKNLHATIQYGKVMTPEQVKNLRSSANDLFEEAKAMQRKIDANYSARAIGYGGDPSRVILDLGQNKQRAEPTAPTNTTKRGNVTITEIPTP